MNDYNEYVYEELINAINNISSNVSDIYVSEQIGVDIKDKAKIILCESSRLRATVNNLFDKD